MPCPLCNGSAIHGIPLSDGTVLHRHCVEALESEHSKLMGHVSIARAHLCALEREPHPLRRLLGRIRSVFHPPPKPQADIRTEQAAAKEAIKLAEASASAAKLRLTRLYDLYLDYPPDWEERRQQVIARDVVCSLCSGAVRKHDRHIHHYIPLGKGGTNRLSNLALLCGRCHAREHGVKQFNSTGQQAPRAFPDRVRILNQAIEASRDVQFLYRKPDDDTFQKRVITPLELLQVAHDTGPGTTLCVRGYCHLRKAERNFALKRMRSLRLQ
jgi:hypothetical protein